MHLSKLSFNGFTCLGSHGLKGWRRVRCRVSVLSVPGAQWRLDLIKVQQFLEYKDVLCMMHQITLIMRRKTATEISSKKKKKRMDSWLNKEALALGRPLHPGDGSGQNGSLYGVGRVHPLHTGGRVTWWSCLTTGQKAPPAPSAEEESMRSLTADYAQNTADFSPSHLQNNRESAHWNAHIRECFHV